jgi:hypothetical protein
MNDPIKLVCQGGATSIHINVRIDENGDLLFSGQDIGNAPEEMFGDLDYEYWLTVPASEKDRLLLALIEKHYAGDALVVSTLREFMESREIPCSFFSH